jgi:hypothetical protein
MVMRTTPAELNIFGQTREFICCGGDKETLFDYPGPSNVRENSGYSRKSNPGQSSITGNLPV